MIAFDLQCANGHRFEGWFQDTKAYETQQKKGLIVCPICSDKQVSKMPSLFSIKSSQAVSTLPKEHLEMEVLTRKVAKYVQENFDDVGCKFATEALKMHYGVSEPRNIRGVSTKAEEKTLKEEGIDFIKLPLPAEPKSETEE